jgi:hypothetical protein
VILEEQTEQEVGVMSTEFENDTHSDVGHIEESLEVSELCILVTDEDINGENILAMSDFFSGYLNQLKTEMRTNGTLEVMSDIPIADFGIIADVINHAEVISHGSTQLIPDFDNLPTDIKEGIKNGKYSIGESRMIDGNLRAVIVDKSGTRVKDITLKKIHINPGTIETTRSIANQLQMRQIYSKLDSINQMQVFQIARDRDRDFKVPFLNARFHILKAQKCNSKKERYKHLEQAADYLLTAENNLYTDITTSTNLLTKNTRFPVFRKRQAINDGIGYISEDLPTLTKIVGLRMQILDYIGDSDSTKIEMERYQRAMTDFFTTPLQNRNYSAAGLIHSVYPYNTDNKDCWYQLAEEMSSTLKSIEMKSTDQVYLVSLEEDENGEK